MNLKTLLQLALVGIVLFIADRASLPHPVLVGYFILLLQGHIFD